VTSAAVSGFTLLHGGGYHPGGWLGRVIDVRVGHVTDYALDIRLEQRSGDVILRFPSPLSFRVQEERDLMDYWCARSGEGVPVGVLYAIARSSYLDEFAGTISGQTHVVTHYLVAGDDLCVEVLSDRSPELPDEWETGSAASSRR